jgi:hypothetical protein
MGWIDSLKQLRSESSGVVISAQRIPCGPLLAQALRQSRLLDSCLSLPKLNFRLTENISLASSRSMANWRH